MVEFVTNRPEQLQEINGVLQVWHMHQVDECAADRRELLQKIAAVLPVWKVYQVVEIAASRKAWLQNSTLHYKCGMCIGCCSKS